MKAFLRSVSMLALLRAAADMLLPAGSARKLCDMLLGLMTAVNILLAVMRLLPGWTG